MNKISIFLMGTVTFSVSMCYGVGWKNTFINNSDYPISITIQYAGKSICPSQDIYSMNPQETRKLKAGICCAQSLLIRVWYKTGNRKDYTITPPTAGIKMTCRSFTLTVNNKKNETTNTVNPEEVEIRCTLN